MAKRDLVWSDFIEEGKHQWIFNDRELKTRYVLRSVDGIIEASIKDELTTDPTETQVEPHIRAFNEHRRSKRIADRRT